MTSNIKIYVPSNYKGVILDRFKGKTDSDSTLIVKEGLKYIDSNTLATIIKSLKINLCNFDDKSLVEKIQDKLNTEILVVKNSLMTRIDGDYYGWLNDLTLTMDSFIKDRSLPSLNFTYISIPNDDDLSLFIRLPGATRGVITVEIINGIRMIKSIDLYEASFFV